MKKILVTGFEAFKGERINPSQLLLQSLVNIPQVDILLLPVSFEKAFLILQVKLQQEHYDYVLLLGQAGGRDKVSLERVAINWRETESADNDGVNAYPGHPILQESEPAYFSSLPLVAMRDSLHALQIPVEISFTAGAYVCNDLFFKTAHLLKNTATCCGFIHVPYLPAQTEQKPGMASMELVTMENAIKALLVCVS